MCRTSPPSWPARCWSLARAGCLRLLRCPRWEELHLAEDMENTGSLHAF